MSKKSRRSGRRNRHDKGGAFGNNRHASGGPKCRYPQYFDDPERCCICGGLVAGCPCGPQKALEHLTTCHQDTPQLREMSSMLASSAAATTSKPAAADPCPNGHPEQAQAWMLHGTPPIRCPKCGETPRFGNLGMSTELGPHDQYGLPQQATRQWIAEHSEPDEFGTVPIPANRQDDLFTHATYWPGCDHIEPCGCHEDDTVTWNLEEYSG